MLAGVVADMLQMTLLATCRHETRHISPLLYLHIYIFQILTPDRSCMKWAQRLSMLKVVTYCL